MANTFINLQYHLVFSTKHRKDFIVDCVRDRLYNYLGAIIRNEKGTMLTIGGTQNHVHILAQFSKTANISNMLQQIKGSSSKWINGQNLLPYHFRWQSGYAAFTVSQSQSGIVSRYIKNQVEHHRKITFKDEFIKLLEKHGIEYDEKLLWQ